MTAFPHIPELFDLSGRTAVVVGAASGLGQASAFGLADAGAHVVCADLDLTGAEATAQMIRQRTTGGASAANTGDSQTANDAGEAADSNRESADAAGTMSSREAAGSRGGAHADDHAGTRRGAHADDYAGSRGCAEAFELDITSTAAVDALVERCSDAEVLVMTPGMNVRKRMTETTDEEFDRVIDVNLKGTYRLMRGFGRAMAERGRGSIITFASFRAIVVEPGQGLYAAAKAGVVQLTKTLASELGTSGVRVNSILPGPFETPLTEQIKSDAEWWDAYAQKAALGRWGLLHEIAGPVLFLASDASSYVTGHSLLVDGGWMAHDGRFIPRV